MSAVIATPNMYRLSQQEALSVLVNGDYITNPSRNDMVYDGDTLVIDQGFINTDLPNGDSVTIDTDVSVGLNFIYYEQNTDFTDKTQVNGTAAADNENYAMYHSDPSGSALNMVIGSKFINLKAGVYSPTEMAQNLTKEFSNTSLSINSPVLSTGNSFLIATDTGTTGGAITKFEDYSWGSEPYPFGSIPNLEGSAESWGQNGTGDFSGTKYYLADGTEGAGGYPTQQFLGACWASMSPGRSKVDIDSDDNRFNITQSSTTGSGTGCIIKLKPSTLPGSCDWFGPNIISKTRDKRFNVTIVDGGQGYQRGDVLYFDYSQFGAVDNFKGEVLRLGSSDYPVTATDGKLKLIVQSITDGDAYFEFMKVGQDPDSPADSYRYNSGTAYWEGATEVDIEFDENSDGLFSIDFAHTPFYKVVANQPKQPAVLIKRDETNSVIGVDCGVALVDMTPRSFWQGILNFDVDNIILKDTNGEPLTTETRAGISTSTFETARTSGYLGLNGFLLNNSGKDSQIRKLPTPGAGDQDPIATTLTNNIKARTYVPNNGPSYYMVSLTGGPFGNAESRLVMANDGTLPFSAVASKQYNSFGTITFYEDSATPYVYHGEPVPLGEIRVQIWQPNIIPYERPVIAKNLGPANTMFLRIDRGQEYYANQESDAAQAAQAAQASKK